MAHFHPYWRALLDRQRNQVLRNERPVHGQPIPESSCEMGIVAKAAGVRDFAEMLTCSVRRPACQQARGVVQMNGMEGFRLN